MLVRHWAQFRSFSDDLVDLSRAAPGQPFFQAVVVGRQEEVSYTG